MYFHGQLARMRPGTEHLNSYFVWMSVGGIAGGIFNGLIAPLAFATQAEYVITILISGLTISLFSRNDPQHVFGKAEKSLLTIAYVIISSFEVKTGKSSCEADLPVFSTCGIWVVKYYFFRRLIF